MGSTKLISKTQMEQLNLGMVVAFLRDLDVRTTTREEGRRGGGPLGRDP